MLPDQFPQESQNINPQPRIYRATRFFNPEDRNTAQTNVQTPAPILYGAGAPLWLVCVHIGLGACALFLLIIQTPPQEREEFLKSVFFNFTRP